MVEKLKKGLARFAEIAARLNVQLAVIAGQVNVKPEDYQKFGIQTAISCRSKDMSLDYMIKNSRALLSCAAEKFARGYLS